MSMSERDQRSQNGAKKVGGSQPRRVNRRQFTRRRDLTTSEVPVWWAGMVIAHQRLREAESELLRARRHRELAVWLAIRHRGASYRWLAQRLGVRLQTVQEWIGRADAMVEERGWTERDVMAELNHAARTRSARERYARDEEGRRMMAAWSAPPPGTDPGKGFEEWSAPPPPRRNLSSDPPQNPGSGVSS